MSDFKTGQWVKLKDQKDKDFYKYDFRRGLCRNLVVNLCSAHDERTDFSTWHDEHGKDPIGLNADLIERIATEYEITEAVAHYGPYMLLRDCIELFKEFQSLYRDIDNYHFNEVHNLLTHCRAMVGERENKKDG